MSWLVSAKQYIPAVIGEPFGGGYFAGYISHTANGSPTHALIVAPAATGSSTLAIKTTNTATTNTDSSFDGAANTAAMVAAGIAVHPAAQFCVNLSIGGFVDWYLPSPAELDVAYFNLKPGTQANDTNSGSNIYAVPSRPANNTTANPSQTYVSLFAGGAQAFPVSPSNGYHWSSRQGGPSNSGSIGLYFLNGSQAVFANTKNTPYLVRAFRRIAL